jgi:hypothetical protein
LRHLVFHDCAQTAIHDFVAPVDPTIK